MFSKSVSFWWTEEAQKGGLLQALMLTFPGFHPSVISVTCVFALVGFSSLELEEACPPTPTVTPGTRRATFRGALSCLSLLSPSSPSNTHVSH